MTAVGMASLVERVKQAVEASGLTQNEVERQMHRSRGYLSKLVSRESQEPRRDSFLSFAKVTGVRVDWLLDETGPMRVTEADELDSPELAAFLKSAAAKKLSEPTIAAVRAFAAKSSERLTEEEIAGLARAIEGQSKMIVHVVDDDPVARAKAKKPRRKQ